MSDFVTRLEAELVDAAGRQQRRVLPVRLPTRRTLVAASLAAAAVLAVVVAVTSGPWLARPLPPARLAPVPAALAGDYARGGTSVILDTRRYTLLLRGGADSVVGDAAVQGGVLLLGNDGTGACRPSSEVARYRVERRGSGLRLTPLFDRCAGRAHALSAGPLHRSG